MPRLLAEGRSLLRERATDLPTLGPAQELTGRSSGGSGICGCCGWLGMPGAHHSELWDKNWTAEEQEAAGASVACGCAVLPVKNCAGGGGAWNEADECAQHDSSREQCPALLSTVSCVRWSSPPEVRKCGCAELSTPRLALSLCLQRKTTS